MLPLLPGHGADDLIAADEEEDDKFAIVFAAMGVNMETAHFFKQVRELTQHSPLLLLLLLMLALA
jgi:vacuolar-type H+-ATPase subunit B/Vma2